MECKAKIQSLLIGELAVAAGVINDFDYRLEELPKAR